MSKYAVSDFVANTNAGLDAIAKDANLDSTAAKAAVAALVQSAQAAGVSDFDLIGAAEAQYQAALAEAQAAIAAKS